MFHAYIIPIATCFIYTLYDFYAFSGTNLLTRCRSASSLFSAIFGFRQAVKKIFSELHKTKAKVPIFSGSIQNTEEETEGGHEAASPGGGATPPWPHHHVVWGPRPSTDVALSPIYSPRRENPRYPIRNPRKVPELPPSSTLVRVGSEALPGTLRRGESSPEGSSSPCPPPD